MTSLNHHRCRCYYSVSPLLMLLLLILMLQQQRLDYYSCSAFNNGFNNNNLNKRIHHIMTKTKTTKLFLSSSSSSSSSSKNTLLPSPLSSSFITTRNNNNNIHCRSPTSLLFSHHQSNYDDEHDDHTTTTNTADSLSDSPSSSSSSSEEEEEEKGGSQQQQPPPEEVVLMRERAKKARQEANEMEESYVEKKIQNLEEKLLNINNKKKQLSNNNSDERQYLIDKINSLKTYLSSSTSGLPSPATAVAAAGDVGSIADKEKQQQQQQQDEEEDEIVVTTDDDDDDDEDEAEEAKEDYVGVLSDDEMKVLKDIQGILNEFQDFFNTSMKIVEQTGIEIDDDDDDDDDTLDTLKELEVDLQTAMAGNITSENLDLIMSVMGFVNFIRRIPGVKSKYNEIKSQIVDMRQYLQESNFTKDDGVGGDEYYYDRLDAIMTLIPNDMVSPSNLLSIGYNNTLNDTDIEEFVNNIMLSPSISKDVFQITSRKPRKLLHIGYIIEGIPLEKDGDVLVSKINEQLNNHLTTTTSGGGGGGASYSQQQLVDVLASKINNEQSTATMGGDGSQQQQQQQQQLVDKLQFFYIRDPSKSVGLDDVQIADMLIGSDEDIDSIDINGRIRNWNNVESPCLLVLPKQLTPNPASPLDYRLLISTIAIILTINFVGGSCYGSDNILKSFYLSVIAHPTILIGLIGLSFVHDIGHYIAAAMNKLQIAVPSTIIPSPSTGILGTSSTSLLTSPKNNKSYYDFAISGPLFGFVTSWVLLVMGLQQTLLVTKSAEINQLPHLPLDFFKLSLLTSSTIESFMGTDVLLSIDPLSEPNVAIHPLAVIGHIGILVNALALLPTSKTSDGGRMLQSSFGRFSIADQLVSPLIVTFLAVQAFRVWNVSNYLAIYFFLGNAFNDDVDVPCRNDVDPAGGIRAIVFVLSLMLVAIAISPAF